MIIEHCNAYLVDVPLRTQEKYGADAPFPFGVYYGTARGLKRVLLELSARRSDKSVVRGFGEASPFYPYSNETALSVYELLTFYYATYLVGQTIALHSTEAAKKDVVGPHRDGQKACLGIGFLADLAAGITDQQDRTVLLK